MAETIHVIPVDDLVQHDTSGDRDCVCGPTPELVETDDGDRWLIVHHSLDGREHYEPDHDRVNCPGCPAG